jgi:predicted nucleotidyltransferase
MNLHGLSISKEKLAAFCARHHIRKLAFFGSVLRKDFRPDSDVDVLVEFEPGRTVGLLRMAGLEMELSQILGRKVDLRTRGDLSRYFRDEVVRTSEVQFVKE